MINFACHILMANNNTIIHHNDTFAFYNTSNSTQFHANALFTKFLSRYIAGVNVHTARKRSGKILAQEAQIDADIVIGVPNSSLSAASGYAEESY